MYSQSSKNRQSKSTGPYQPSGRRCFQPVNREKKDPVIPGKDIEVPAAEVVEEIKSKIRVFFSEHSFEDSKKMMMDVLDQFHEFVRKL
jgi:hypothetical protein